MNACPERLVVLIPAHCDQACLDATLDSVAAAQRPCEVRAVVVDDASCIPLGVDPGRLRGLPVTLLRLGTNQGIESALNAGLDAAEKMAAEYIARIDAGDRMAPDRLVRQVGCLRSHREIGIVGSHVDFVDVQGMHLFRFSPPATDRQIRRAMHINSCLPHPTVTIRASVLKEAGRYSTAYAAAEDYELFFRILQRAQASCVPEPLTTMVFDPRGISASRRARQLRSRLKVQVRYFDWRLAQSYLGVILTLALMIVPNRLLVALKRWRGASRY